MLSPATPTSMGKFSLPPKPDTQQERRGSGTSADSMWASASSDGGSTTSAHRTPISQPRSYALSWVFWTGPDASQGQGAGTLRTVNRTNWMQPLAPASFAPVQHRSELAALLALPLGKAALLEAMQQAAPKPTIGAMYGFVQPKAETGATVQGGALGTANPMVGSAILPPKPRASSIGAILPTRPDTVLRSAGQPLVQALFQDGIQPAWEDPANAKGGAWSLNLPLSWSGEQLWQVWHAVLQAVTSGSLERSPGQKGQKAKAGLVAGTMLSIKPRGVRMSVWVHSSAQLVPSPPCDDSAVEEDGKEQATLATVGQQFARVISNNLCSIKSMSQDKKGRSLSLPSQGTNESAPLDGQNDWPKHVRFSAHHADGFNKSDLPDPIALVSGPSTGRAPRGSGKAKSKGSKSQGGDHRQSNKSKDTTGGGKTKNDNLVPAQESSSLLGTVAVPNEQGE